MLDAPRLSIILKIDLSYNSNIKLTIIFELLDLSENGNLMVLFYVLHMCAMQTVSTHK